MKKKITILSIFLAVLMTLALNVGNVKAAATGQDIVDYAKKFRGIPYATNGTTPAGFDCSGFVQYVYKNAAGINLPRDTYGQIGVGTPVSQSELQPGDLVFPHTGHVGIYVGGGQMIHSPKTGDVVKIAPIYKFYQGRRISGVTQYPKVSPNAKPIKSSYMLIVTSPQPVRTAPVDSASVVRTLKYGERIDIYAQYGPWSLIARGNTQQWIRSTYLAPAVPTALNGNEKPVRTGFMIAVLQPQTVRMYPSDTGWSTGTLKYGDKVDIYAEYGPWSLVARGSTPKWIRSTYLAKAVPTALNGNEKPIETGLMMIIPDSQTVRMYPSDTGWSTGTLNHGDKVDVYGRYGDWSLVARGSTPKWIRSTYLAPAVPTADKGTESPITTTIYKVIQSSVSARIYPSDTAWISRELKQGETVNIYGQYGDWYLIGRGKKAQWVKKSVLQPV
ncbi:NlpC/P60 family protein [Clostridium sp. Marseille-Q2269]|uniref:NlpC/P60 family protein n=1 Tax=Clostridium sp. Marseille-Q2269 TaxID=2942205 RepID=UPI002073FCAB|nr:NlpC/P60 family protein [Clostridium sp. Marseille-Q2269]